MRYIPVEVRRLVSQRAAGRCEYCGLSREGQEATFHIDHIVPVVAGGQTTADNLALACVSCSLRKAARQTAIDSQTGEEAAIYNPRRERWSDHFRWEGVRVVGQTATGRVTVAALDMNRPLILAIRQEEATLNQTTGQWYGEAHIEKTQTVRSERSRASGEVEEQAGRGARGLRLRSATLRPNGDRINRQ